MAGNIKINTEGLSGSLSSFQAEMAKMQTLLGEIKSATAAAKNDWRGTASDAIMGGIEKFQAVFEEVESQNNKYVAFLNAVIDAYTVTDENLSASLEANADAYSVGE